MKEKEKLKEKEGELEGGKMSFECNEMESWRKKGDFGHVWLHCGFHSTIGYALFNRSESHPDLHIHNFVDMLEEIGSGAPLADKIQLNFKILACEHVAGSVKHGILDTL